MYWGRKAHTAPTTPRTSVAAENASGLRFFSGLNGMSSLQSHSSQKMVSWGLSCPHLGHLMRAGTGRAFLLLAIGEEGLGAPADAPEPRGLLDLTGGDDVEPPAQCQHIAR